MKINNYRLGNINPDIKGLNSVGIIARTISIYFVLTMCGLHIIPIKFTNIIKPLFIYILLLEILILRKKLIIKSEHFISLIMIIYLSFVFMKTGINEQNFKGFIPLVLNMMVFILATQLKCNKNEIILLVNSIFMGGVIFAIGIAISNPIISNNISRLNIKYFSNSLNANGIPYLIVPSVVIGIKKLMCRKNTYISRLIILSSLIIMIYTILYTNSRGAILALILSIILLLYKNFRWNAQNKRMFNNILLLLLLSFVVIGVFQIIPKSITNRLFGFSEYSLNSRDNLWMIAISLSRNNIMFGNGFDYWTQMTGMVYGAHNLYIDLLLSVGIIGSVGMLLFVINVIIKSRDLILLALLTAPIINSILESGTSYDFWNPVILCVLIYSSNYFKSHNS